MARISAAHDRADIDMARISAAHDRADIDMARISAAHDRADIDHVKHILAQRSLIQTSLPHFTARQIDYNTHRDIGSLVHVVTDAGPCRKCAAAAAVFVALLTLIKGRGRHNHTAALPFPTPAGRGCTALTLRHGLSSG